MNDWGSDCTCEDRFTGRDPSAAPTVDRRCPVHGDEARSRVRRRERDRSSRDGRRRGRLR